ALSVTGLLADATDVDGDSLTAILVSGPSHGSLTLNSDGSFTYTSAANYNGSDSFVYQVNDGTADSNLPTVTLSLLPVHRSPLSTPVPTRRSSDLALSVTGLLADATDVDGDPLTAILVSGPSHGSLTLNSDGSFTYTPAANYNGSDSFVY